MSKNTCLDDRKRGLNTGKHSVNQNLTALPQTRQFQIQWAQTETKHIYNYILGSVLCNIFTLISRNVTVFTYVILNRYISKNS